MADDPTIRNHNPGDASQWLALLNASPDCIHDFFNQRPSFEALRMVVEHPHMDPAHNLFFAEREGRFVGYAEVWRTPGRTRTVGRVLVHPDWRRRGLGTALLRHVERRSRAEGGRYLDVLVAGQNEAGCRFLQSHGCTRVHYGWHMVLPDVRSAAAPLWPPGYTCRTFVPGQDEVISCRLENASFQGEWEYTPYPLAETEGFVQNPFFRPEGVFYAVSDGQVIGECWNWIDVPPSATPSPETRGDIWCLCVLPDHRGRGLGRALLLAGIQWLRQQGMIAACLTVDGANERARHLYESVGFVADRNDIWYRKEL